MKSTFIVLTLTRIQPLRCSLPAAADLQVIVDSVLQCAPASRKMPFYGSLVCTQESVTHHIVWHVAGRWDVVMTLHYVVTVDVVRRYMTCGRQRGRGRPEGEEYPQRHVKYSHVLFVSRRVHRFLEKGYIPGSGVSPSECQGGSAPCKLAGWRGRAPGEKKLKTKLPESHTCIKYNMPE